MMTAAPTRCRGLAILASRRRRLVRPRRPPCCASTPPSSCQSAFYSRIIVESSSTRSYQYSCVVSHDQRRYSSSTSILSRLQQSLMPRDWHHPNFMARASAADKEAWLQDLLEESGRHDEAVDTEAFLIVLRALATASELPDAALRAERWLVRLEKVASGDDGNSYSNLQQQQQQQQQQSKAHEQSTSKRRRTPTPECYQRVIEAWAAARTEDPALAVTRSERWLICRTHKDGSSIRPNTACYNAFLDLCSKGRALKSGANGRLLVAQHAAKAKKTLLLMLDDVTKHGADSVMAPDTDSFNYVIRAFTRMRFDPAVADNAMEILRLLEEYEQKNDAVGPNIKSYAMVMDAIAVRAKQIVKGNRNKKHLWKEPAHNGMNQITMLKDILAYMQDKSGVSAGNNSTRRHPHHHHLEPNTHAYNVLISAWANLSSPMHPDAPLEAERVLQHMIRLRDHGYALASPDAYSYQMVMRAWKNSNKAIRGSRVSWWLQKQWKDYEFEGNEALQPTTASYNIVMQVWARIGKPKEAEEVLAELYQFKKDDRRFTSIAPNTESYAAVIKAWLAVADKGSLSALEAAAKWLRHISYREKNDSLLVVSSVDWYSDFLSATRKCASQYPQSLELAIEMFELLRSSHHAVDGLHYSRLIQAGLMAMSQEHDNQKRADFMKKYVPQCCEEGLVSRPLIRALTNGPVYYDGWTIEESMRCLDEFFPDWPLPTAWTRNIRQEGFLPIRSDLFRRDFYLSHHGRRCDLQSSSGQYQERSDEARS